MSLRPFRARLKTAATSAPGAGALRITAAADAPGPLGPDTRSRRWAGPLRRIAFRPLRTGRRLSAA